MTPRQQDLLSREQLEVILPGWLASEAPTASPVDLEQRVVELTAGLPQRSGRTWLPPIGWRGGARPMGVALASMALVAVGVVAAILVLARPDPLPAGPLVSAGDLLEPRYGHVAVELPGGEVLVIGGSTGGGPGVSPEPLYSAELWDPATAVFVAAGTLIEQRRDFSATALSDGRVLVIGGRGQQTDRQPQPQQRFASVEIWDPSTRAFNLAGSLDEPRFGHTATLLQDGRVLVAGGAGGRYQYQEVALGTFEVWDPSSGTSVANGALVAPRFSHTATTLDDGRVLLAGGYGEWVNQGHAPVTTAEVWDPRTSQSSPTGEMAQARVFHSAELLADGRVLIVGGSEGVIDWDADETRLLMEVWDPRAGRFGSAGSFVYGRGGYAGQGPPISATRLDDGRVALIGGPSGIIKTWDPAAGSSSVGLPLGFAITGHSATLLPNGRVLIVGGRATAQPFGWGDYLDGALLYDPSAPLPTPTPRSRPVDGSDFQPAGELSDSRSLHQASRLQDGRVLVLGGSLAYRPDVAPQAGCLGHSPPTEAWDPASGQSITLPAFPEPRNDYQQVPLADGRVLVIGGYLVRGDAWECISEPIRSAVLWDPLSGKIEPAGQRSLAIVSSEAVALADGRVLLIGGNSADDGLEPPTGLVEIWDPGQNSFSAAGSIPEGWKGFSATELTDGRVLLAGGWDVDVRCTGDASNRSCDYPRTPAASSQLWDPKSRTFTPTGELTTARVGHSATLLSDGRVLMIGGRSHPDWPNQEVTSIEVWDPATGQFTPAGSLPDPRPWHTATLLTDGRVLIAGGTTGPSLLWDPATNSVHETASLVEPRLAHSAVLLADGRVAILGGQAYAPDGAYLSTVEIYQPPVR